MSCIVMWGSYNAVHPSDESGTVHVGEVNYDDDPIIAICKTTRSKKLIPISGYIPRRRFCRACLAKLKEES